MYTRIGLLALCFSVLVALGTILLFTSAEKYPGAPADKADLEMLWGAQSGEKGPCKNAANKCEFCYTCVSSGTGCAGTDPGKPCTLGSDGNSGTAADNCNPVGGVNTCMCGALNKACGFTNNDPCRSILKANVCVTVSQGCQSTGASCTCNQVIAATMQGTWIDCKSP